MKRIILAALAVAAIPTSVALASGTAPTAPGIAIQSTTQHGIYVKLTRPSCDADGDFGSGTGVYLLRIDGVQTPDAQLAIDANCAATGTQGFVFGDGSYPGSIPCGTGHTVSVRAQDVAGHNSTWTNIQGVKTLPC
jgi:hypothetical protein